MGRNNLNKVKNNKNYFAQFMFQILFFLQVYNLSIFLQLNLQVILLFQALILFTQFPQTLFQALDPFLLLQDGFVLNQLFPTFFSHLLLQFLNIFLNKRLLSVRLIALHFGNSDVKINYITIINLFILFFLQINIYLFITILKSLDRVS